SKAPELESVSPLPESSEPAGQEEKGEDKKVKELLDVSMTSILDLDFLDKVLEEDVEPSGDAQISLEKPASGEEKPLRQKPKTFAPITDEQTKSQVTDKSSTIPQKKISDKEPEEEHRPKPETEPVVSGKEEIAEEEKMNDWREKNYFLIIPLKEKINFRLLSETIARYNNVSLAVAERALVNGKGIILHNVPYEDARELRDSLRQKGQNIIAIVDDDAAHLPPAEEVLKGWFYSELLELQLEKGLTSQQFKWKDVLFLSCGNIDCDPGRGAYKNLLDIIVNTEKQSKQHLRIWETTFDFKSSNLPLKKIAQENFLLLVEQVYKYASNAVMTQVVIEMIRQKQLSPRRFGSMETYENYLLWNYLYHFGTRLPG
ncbi:hypothetical protein J7M23_12385, partial [Candidatus Sumerlaeota bacterium]|nr:hypothetical protein [Candidatus Sumerlaeota bacterium]